MNRIINVLLALAVITACAGNPASESAGPVSASTNAPGCEYPKVNPDLSVEFRACFPDAQEVAVDICSKVYPMAKAENGEWTVTVDPQEPGFHYYFLIVDGKRIADFKKCRRDENQHRHTILS
jgi:enterochelin esterase family protein